MDRKPYLLAKTMTKAELDYLGSMNMSDELSNEAYQKIVNHFEEPEETFANLKKQIWKDAEDVLGNDMVEYYTVIDIIARYFGLQEEE